jgi:hypothetical protein
MNSSGSSSARLFVHSDRVHSLPSMFEVTLAHVRKNRRTAPVPCGKNATVPGSYATADGRPNKLGFGKTDRSQPRLMVTQETVLINWPEVGTVGGCLLSATSFRTRWTSAFTREKAKVEESGIYAALLKVRTLSETFGGVRLSSTRICHRTENTRERLLVNPGNTWRQGSTDAAN